MKRRLLVLGLGAAFIAALAILLWRHAHAPPPRGRPLFATAPAAATRIDARWASGKRIALRRTREGWRMTAPVHAPADPTRVDAFLAATAEPITRTYTAASVPLTRAGLAPARLTLRINGEHAELGSRNPASGLRYVHKDGRVLVLADTLLPRLAAGPWQFLSTRLLPPGSRLTRVRVDGENAGASIRRAWQDARARVVGPLPATAPRPLGHVELTLAPGTATLGFAIVARHPLQLLRSGEGLVYTFPPSAASNLLPRRARTPGG